MRQRWKLRGSNNKQSAWWRKTHYFGQKSFYFSTSSPFSSTQLFQRFSSSQNRPRFRWCGHFWSQISFRQAIFQVRKQQIVGGRARCQFVVESIQYGCVVFTVDCLLRQKVVDINCSACNTENCGHDLAGRLRRLRLLWGTFSRWSPLFRLFLCPRCIVMDPCFVHGYISAPKLNGNTLM